VTSIDTLYREHSGRVYRFALSLSGNRAVAEDLTSETFVRLWTARERLDLTTVLGYLLTITRRLYLQGLSRARRGEPLVTEPADERPGHDAVVEGRDALEAVLADLQTLPEPDRAAVLMRAQDALPYEEIAAALGISGGAAKVKVHRARQRLLGLRRARERRGPP
jgi:RNA polymerase sigma-70 factor (ECF subfamily)